MAKLLILAGALLVVAGVLLHFGLLGWVGRLPGDIRVEGDGYAFYFPLATMIVVSIVLSLAIRLLRPLL